MTDVERPAGGPVWGAGTSADMSRGKLDGDFFKNVFDGVVCEEAFFHFSLFDVRFIFDFSSDDLIFRCSEGKMVR